ncbi:ricin-type beta-trefoil lectin domain protein [Streptomyces sp. NBC_00872]|uniref:ricin-type beta-trefoil lectin domain protein n=1 Tax=Streptomyces sp. NBC_00872 TaxID=2903686 RepID=UPI003868F220|nr:RICIN domain-containing protein [Streptomyces sp. NBC_00872]
MADLFRKLLVPGLLALASSVLPSTAVAAAAPADVAPGPAVGTMCLASDYPRTRIVNVESCNSSGPRQHWTISGESISQSQYPDMCLASNYPKTRIINVEPCNSSGPRQHWTVNGESISQSQYPEMCLASDYPKTRLTNVEPCNPSGLRQHWTVQGEQISMTLV